MGNIFSASSQKKTAFITDTVLMVRPASFRMNEQTAVNNHFQEDLRVQAAKINAEAQKEFDNFVSVLSAKQIEVVVVEDEAGNDTPDSIFPNNWISFHTDGTVAFYPMYAQNRRKERLLDVFGALKERGFKVDKVVDYSKAEQKGRFLEGTGSIILDRENKTAYCALSERSDETLFRKFCTDFEYSPVVFIANQTVDKNRVPIYHTNVMMCIASTFAIICLDCIDDKSEREFVVNRLRKDGKQIIPINEEQLYQFAGNMLQVKDANNYPYLVMSSLAANSLLPHQIISIQKHCDIVHAPLITIETFGGGSARCMMAEVFLPKLVKGGVS